MWIETKTIAEQAKPGQFVSVYTRDGSKLLPRPISLCEIDKEKKALRLVYRVTGKNTGTESWQIKSISELNDFRLEHLEHPLLYEGRLPMKVGNKVKPGEAVAVDIYVKPNLSQGIHEETFVMETEEGIQAECRIRVLVRGESEELLV